MYEMNAREYNDKVMRGHFKKVYPVIASQILGRTGIEKGNCIDLGGGPGMLGISYARITEAHVTIYDLLPACIEIAKENITEFGLDEQMAAIQGKAENICFPDNSIDLVMSRGSVFFWEDQQKAFGEIHRVLKPGGWAYIGGGFGTPEILAEVLEQKRNDPDWEEGRKKRMAKNPPEQFQSILQSLEIPGVVETGNAGTWTIFQKQ